MLERLNTFRAPFAIVAVVLPTLLGPALAHTPESHPQLTQSQRDWYNSAKNMHGGSCCNNNDGSVTHDWKMDAGKYHVLIEGNWYEVPEFALVWGNPNAEAVVWYFRDLNGNVGIRCFSPGLAT
jgi:hypothetical protein